MIILLDVGVIIGGILSLIGIGLFLILLFFTNYVNVSIALGLACVGLLSIVSNFFFIIQSFLDHDEEKKKKIISIVLLSIIIISMIFSFFKPLVLSGLNIRFSQIASILVEPIIIYIIISIYYWSTTGSETKQWSIGLKLFSFVVATAIGIIISGFAYYTKSDGLLDFLNNNFKYEKVSEIETRKRLYNSNDFEKVFPKLLEREKKVYYDKGYSQETIEKEAFQRKRTYEGYKIQEKELETEHIYLLTVLDTTIFDETNDYPKYYVVVNLESFEIVEFRKNSTGIEDNELAKKLENIEKAKKISEHDFMFYTLQKMKSINAEITCENINQQAKYLKDKDRYRCYSIEKNGEEYNFTLRFVESYRSGVVAITGKIYGDYTSRIDY